MVALDAHKTADVYSIHSNFEARVKPTTSSIMQTFWEDITIL